MPNSEIVEKLNDFLGTPIFSASDNQTEDTLMKNILETVQREVTALK